MEQKNGEPYTLLKSQAPERLNTLGLYRTRGFPCDQTHCNIHCKKVVLNSPIQVLVKKNWDTHTALLLSILFYYSKTQPKIHHSTVKSKAMNSND